MISCESYPNSAREKDCDSSSDSEHITQPQRDTPSAHPFTPTLVRQVIEEGTDSDFEAMLSLLEFQGIQLSKRLHYRLMKCFYRCFKGMGEGGEGQQWLIFVMSLMAEIARRNEKVKLPFTRKIVLALLSFDCNTIEAALQGGQIMKILAVLLGNLARQQGVARKLRVEDEVKRGLLLLIGRVDELSTFQILLRTMRSLISSSAVPLTREEQEGVSASLREAFGEEVGGKLEEYLWRASARGSQSGKSLKDLIESC